MRRKKEKKENSERWLLTYSDLITLLMILFVILYALSTVDASKYEQLAQSLNSAMGGGIVNGGAGVMDGSSGVLNGNNGVLENDATTQETTTADTQTETTVQETESSSANMGGSTDLTNEQQLLEVKDAILGIVENSELKGSVYFTIEDRGLVVSFADDAFFDSGKAAIKDNMMTNLDKIANVLNQFDNTISIEGHTDNIPINNSEFASNWQLSAERAANVVQYLTEQDGILPQRLSAVGYGEYKPYASNETTEGRAKNRRVNMVILYDETTKSQ